MATAAPARKQASRAAPRPAQRRRPSRAAARPRRATRKTANLPTPPGGHLIPLAVGRTAVAVRQLPDTRPIVRLTRGRAWIGVLGVLLTGIVALNVATLSFTASAGKIDRQIQTLEQENSVLRARLAQRLSNPRVQAEAAALGLARPGLGEIEYRQAGKPAIEAAAQRLAAASG
jgi:hypothetical protein